MLQSEDGHNKTNGNTETETNLRKVNPIPNNPLTGQGRLAHSSLSENKE